MSEARDIWIDHQTKLAAGEIKAPEPVKDADKPADSTVPAKVDAPKDTAKKAI